MSLSDHRYVARIAPVSLTSTDAIHAGQILIDESGQRVNESFAAGGLIWPTKPCPVLIDHDEKFPVGFVSDFAERDGWNEATFVLNMDKPLADVAQEILRVGTPVSLGAKSLRRDESLADLGLATPVKRHTIAFLQEVSILSPESRPAFKGAQVIRIEERGTALDRMRERERERANAKPAARPEPAGEVFYGAGTHVRRPGGQVLAVDGRALRVPQGHPVRHVRGDIVIDRPDGSQVIYSGHAGRAEAIRDGVLMRTA